METKINAKTILKNIQDFNNKKLKSYKKSSKYSTTIKDLHLQEDVQEISYNTLQKISKSRAFQSTLLLFYSNNCMACKHFYDLFNQVCFFFKK
jgi:transposase